MAVHTISFEYVLPDEITARFPDMPKSVDVQAQVLQIDTTIQVLSLKFRDLKATKCFAWPGFRKMIEISALLKANE